VARKKSLEGAAAARVASVFGLGGFVPNYDQFVQLYLNATSATEAHAFYTAVSATAGGGEAIPNGWIAAAIDDPREATKWRQWDLKRTLRRLGN